MKTINITLHCLEMQSNRYTSKQIYTQTDIQISKLRSSTINDL